MVAGADAGDVELFVDGDIAFHDVIMRASGNLIRPVHVRAVWAAAPPHPRADIGGA